MNTIQIIHKLHELAEHVEWYEAMIEKAYSRPPDFTEQVLETAQFFNYPDKLEHQDENINELQKLDFDELFKRFLNSKRYNYLRAICLKMGVEI